MSQANAIQIGEGGISKFIKTAKPKTPALNSRLARVVRASTVESESASIWLFQPGRNAKRLAEIECKKAISTQAPRSQSTIIHRKVQQHT